MNRLIKIIKGNKISTVYKQKPMKPESHQYKFYDIAANLTDRQFGGHYNGKNHHEDDRI